MPEPIECEIYIAMNEDGAWIVTQDETDALSKLGEDEGGYQGRVVKIKVTMTPPVMDGATVTIPDTAGTVAAQTE
jgi:hypothetical protein